MAHGPWKPGIGRFLGSRHVSVEWIPMLPLAGNSEKDDRERSSRPDEPEEPEGYATGSPRRTERFVTDWVVEE